MADAVEIVYPKGIAQKIQEYTLAQSYIKAVSFHKNELPYIMQKYKNKCCIYFFVHQGTISMFPEHFSNVDLGSREGLNAFYNDVYVPNLPTAYIGKTGNVNTRFIEHHIKEWKEGICFFSELGDGFSKSGIDFLENYYFKFLKRNIRVKPLNDHINFYKKTQVEQAAIFLYLTHANYRGLYRVNKKGEFNVGYGNRPASEFLIDYSNGIDISEFLKNKCEILCGNFIDAINSCKRDDFIYLDSPYYQSFNQYDRKKFTNKDFESMKEIVKELDRKGCKVLISNNDHEYIIQLFKEYEIVRIKAPNNVNAANKIKRKVIKRSEILIKNY